MRKRRRSSSRQTSPLADAATFRTRKRWSPNLFCVHSQVGTNETFCTSKACPDYTILPIPILYDGAGRQRWCCCAHMYKHIYIYIYRAVENEQFKDER